MGQNYCNRCDRRHNTPVGCNCTRKGKTSVVYQPPKPVVKPVVRPTMSDVNNPVLPAVGVSTDDDPEIEITTPAATAPSLENQMTNLESMLSKLTESLLAQDSQEREPRPCHRHRSASWSSADSTVDSHKKHSHRQRSPSK